MRQTGAMSGPVPLRISFVCTGNICRSPMGEVIFRRLAEDAGLGDRVEVSSRGTGGWHIGDGADHRAVAALTAAGYDGTAHRAAQLSDDDIASVHLFVALAREHREALIDRGVDADRVVLLSAYDPEGPSDPDVFDPYFSDQEAFDTVRDQVERSCLTLFADLREAEILVA